MMKTAVIGGGAAGFFLAINLKEQMPTADVVIFERSQRLLAKVEVSGGGRCNCTNTFQHVCDLSSVYPRGHRLMKRLFNVFGPHDAYEWFERHGVSLVVQDDQCVFPAAQDSHVVMDCFMREAHRLGIEIQRGVKVQSLADVGGSLLLISQFTLYADCKKGNRPSFINAGDPAHAEELYDYIVEQCRAQGFETQTGVFGAMMDVDLLNDGPFTIVLDSDSL